MQENDFLENVRKQFDETDPQTIMMSSKFSEIDEWCSLVGLGVIAMIRDIYGVKLPLIKMKEVQSVMDLYLLVRNEMNSNENSIR